MSIRIPPKADHDLNLAFQDVVDELRKLRALLDETLSQRAAPALPTEPRDLAFVDASTLGAGQGGPGTVLTSDGAGNATWAPPLGGAVAAVTPGTAGTSPAQQVVEVHGSLAVTGALQADTITCRELWVKGVQITA